MKIWICKPEFTDCPWAWSDTYYCFVYLTEGSRPLNNTGSNCTGPLIFFSINIQSSFHILGLASLDTERPQYSLYYAILCKGLEHLWILVYGGAPGTSLLQMLRDNCTFNFSVWISEDGTCTFWFLPVPAKPHFHTNPTDSFTSPAWAGGHLLSISNINIRHLC